MEFIIDVVMQADESFLKSLFIALTGQEEEDDDDDDKKDCGGSSDDSDETKLRRRQDVAQFLREFCLFSQTLAPQNRDSFFKVSIFILNEYMLPF